MQEYPFSRLPYLLDYLDAVGPPPTPWSAGVRALSRIRPFFITSGVLNENLTAYSFPAASDIQASPYDLPVGEYVKPLDPEYSPYTSHYSPWYGGIFLPETGPSPDTAVDVAERGIHLPGPSVPMNHVASTRMSTVSTSSQSALPTNAASGLGPSAVPAVVCGPNVPGQVRRRGFKCTICHKTFDRKSRLVNCGNRHRGVKPYRCGGRCQDPNCEARYASADYLRRHRLSNQDRSTQCSQCGQRLSRQNMSRHKASCV